MIRAMEERDIPTVVDLHRKYIPEALFPLLGDEFMRRFYRSLVRSPLGVNMVFERESGAVAGFISAATDSKRIFRHMLRENFLPFFAAGLRFILLNPRKAGECIETFLYPLRVGEEGIAAELLFISVDKDLRGTTLATDLVANVMEEFSRRGINKAKVTTHDFNRGAIKILEANGFTLGREIRFRSKSIYLFTYGK
jgi:ribosomal protein S18 acetylase RimI-like enzyme